jgi:hypothetical protein
LRVGDMVLVKTFFLEPGRSKKLAFPVAGPYPVVEISGPNVDIRTKEGIKRLNLDRVIRCPVDLPTGIEWAPVVTVVCRHQRCRLIALDDRWHCIGAWRWS